MTDSSLYDTDIVAWADRQVEELRRLAEAGVTNTVDWANVIEEIESVGRSEWSGVRSQLVHALAHIIKGVCDPDSLSGEAWRGEVRIALGEARDDFRRSMRPHLDLDEIWRKAFRRAAARLEVYGIEVPPRIPQASPFTLDDLLDPAFQYDDGRRRLRDILTRDSGETL